MADYAIELKNLTKTFGDVVANDNVSLSVGKGEIHALLGENGSGKTTLMNMLSGFYRPESGQIFVDGKAVEIHTPEDSKELGIGMVHQHYKLVEKFTAADNIWIGGKTPPYGWKDKVAAARGAGKNALSKFGKTAAEACKCALHYVAGAFLTRGRYKITEEFCRAYGFDIDVRKKVYDMSVGEKQTLEIIKVLYYGAHILILDEPTAVLTAQEIDKLFGILRKMRDAGNTVIIITHKLNEVMEISDRVSVLRKGKYIGTVETAQTDEMSLTEMMVGEKVDLDLRKPPRAAAHLPLLEIKDLTVHGTDGVKALDGFDLTLYEGEILGIAGISGSGQKELCEAIAGLIPVKGGTILYKGENITGKSPVEIINKGISMSFIPEDRLGMGLAGSMSIADNMMLKSYRAAKWKMPDRRLWPFLDKKSAENLAGKVVRNLNVSAPDITKTPVRRLSGGNVQKVLLGREIEAQPQLIVTAYAVRGLDINSSYLIYDTLNEQKQKGVGIVFVGEDLDVMLGLCDEIAVICHGRFMGQVEADCVTKEQLGLMMTGTPAEDVLAAAREEAAE